jgi:alpha-N-arabinofuranosidase
MTSKVLIDLERRIAPIDPKLFGGFLEHMGRAIYEGIYDPASPLSDERGFRCDVLAALKELNPPVIRYPGGNFLSGYHWLDGVGARDKRPVRRDLAWRSIETNQFGTDEFIAYCRELGTQPMLGVNMGIGSIEEAGALVEYCNAAPGSYYADLRARNGHADPYGVKYWCLGNEMDGAWQIGHLEAYEYGRKALETAKLMRWHDSTIKLVLCGSSGGGMPTFPEWDRTALELAWEQVDYLSMHHYAGNRQDDTPSYLAYAIGLEEDVDALAATLRYVKAKMRSKREVYLSWDEWNVWYKDQVMDGKWTQAPHLIEEMYNLEDALVVAQWLNVFLRRSDVLKMACLAQLVNVIAPILTRQNALLKQSIFYPLKLFSQMARGIALDVLCHAPLYETRQYGAAPLLDVSASYDEAEECGSLFIVNRSLNENEPVEVVWQGQTMNSPAHVWQMAGSDPKAANSFEQPHTIVAHDLGELALREGNLSIKLPPLSFTAIAWRS